MRKILCSVLILFALPLYAKPQEGWQTSLSGAATLNFFDSANSSMGVGFDAGFIQRFFFHPNIGLFFGAQFSQKQLKFDAVGTSPAASGSGRYLDLPLGLSFQVEAWKVGFTQFDFGAYYALPVGDYIIEGFKYSTEGHFGILARVSFIFPIDDTFYVGPLVGLKYPFADTVTAPGGSTTKSSDVTLGLTGQLIY